MSEPAVERLGEELSMKDDFGDEDYYIPTRPGPESSPAPPDVDIKFSPFGDILCSFKGSLQPHTDMEAHPPKEENHRWKKHDVEDEMFVHGFLKGSRILGF
jgi:hypothetical protein